MADWHFVLATTDGQEQEELERARDRKITWRLRESADASFSIDGRDPKMSQLHALTSDVHVYRDGQRMFAGRVTPGTDDIDTSTHSTSVTAVDYRAMLDRRLVYVDSSGTADIADVAWQLIADTQGGVIIPGGDWGITRGTFGSNGIGTTRTYHVAHGQTVAEAIDLLADTWGGFEWQVDSWRRWQAWARRGTDLTGFAVAYTSSGGNVASISRAADSGDFANAVRVVGADDDGGDPPTPLLPAVRFVTGVENSPEGRIEVGLGQSDLKTQAQIDAYADTELARRSTIVPSYTATLAAGVWEGMDTCWLGDSVPVVIQSGRLNVNTRDRITEVSADIGDDGSETVTLTFGFSRRDVITLLRRLPARLERLERR